MKPLDGQVALVTGSSRGIGRAIAAELALAGAAAVINYAASATAAEEAAAQLREACARVAVIRADVSDFAQTQSLIEQTVHEFGRIDILVNNAGITRDKTLKNMTFDDWQMVMRVNLDSVFNCTKAVLPHMIQQRGGKIINISSVIGQMGNLGQANYAASKAGMIGFAKAAALELARYGITVNAVCPGFVESDMLEQVPQHIRENLIGRIPLRRFGQAREVGRAVLYLVTDGGYMTGQTLNLNGGLFSLVG
ncbi:MAG: 3-oxoacyl-ACP reductase [Chloroflexi bacterium]|nr:3-oxoacyl-ACP reductase [Chloroflexota bacterium]